MITRPMLSTTSKRTTSPLFSWIWVLDMRISSKIQQIEALNDLATSATSVLTGMPHNPNKATSKMADAVAKIVDLQAEINHDIDMLVDLKREISSTIKAVPSSELQTLLEKRYLCCVVYYRKWTCYYPLLERICVHRKEIHHRIGGHEHEKSCCTESQNLPPARDHNPGNAGNEADE